jgi:DNA-binding NarL/FixJ family response regulator
MNRATTVTLFSIKVIMPVKVTITDDHPIVANAINTILSSNSNITVTGVFHSAPELLQNIALTNPDVLILDKQLQKADALETVRILIKNMPSLQILIFSSNDILYYVKKMLDAGCRGYLLKNADDEMLIRAVETVAKGSRFLSPSLELALQEELLPYKKNSRRITLTKREKEVMELIVNEYTNPEIAAKLFLSEFTIDSHRTSIMQKLGAKNTAGLVRVAIQTGLV